MEELYKQFPDVHPNIVLKLAMLRDGMQIGNSARRQFAQMDDVLWKGMHFFSFDQQKTTLYGEKIPNEVILPDGCPFQMRTNVNSNYVLDFLDGQFVITEGEETIAGPLSFSRKPKWFDMALEDGTMVRNLVEGTNCGEVMFICLNKYCELWNTRAECLFCDINATLTEQKRGGQDPVARKEPAQIAEAVKLAMEVEPTRRCIEVTGGTILGKYRGQTQLEFFCSHLEAIRDRIQVWVPSIFQIMALDDEGWRRVYDTGVQTIQPNIEVWDKKLFKWICPGKERFIGYDEWIRRVIRAVDFWGRGRVNPNFVIGVEMAKPGGFEDISSAVKSTAGGWDFLMSHDVLPRYNLWCVEPGSAFQDQEPPPLEYFIEVEKAYAELRWKHRFDPPFPGTFTRWSYTLNCLQDFEYYHGSSIMSKRSQEAALKRGLEKGLAV